MNWSAQDEDRWIEARANGESWPPDYELDAQVKAGRELRQYYAWQDWIWEMTIEIFKAVYGEGGDEQHDHYIDLDIEQWLIDSPLDWVETTDQLIMGWKMREAARATTDTGHPA